MLPKRVVQLRRKHKKKKRLPQCRLAVALDALMARIQWRKRKYRKRKTLRKKQNLHMSVMTMMMEVMVTMKTTSDPFWRWMPKREKFQGEKIGLKVSNFEEWMISYFLSL